jgi:hypothetical protein
LKEKQEELFEVQKKIPGIISAQTKSETLK